MDGKQLDCLTQWFTAHVQTFDGGDADMRLHIGLKEAHTKRVVETISELVAELEWEPSRQRIAAAAALLHDVGRFSQYSIYRTFNDARSINHALLGTRILREEGVWESAGLSEPLVPKLERVILYHNVREVPKKDAEEVLALAHLLRDADKLDIYQLIASEMMPPSKELKNVKIASNAIVQAILSGRMAHRRDMLTSLDQLLFRLSWVYNIQYAATLRRLVDSGLWQKISEMVPNQPAARKVLAHLHQYVIRRAKEK